MSLFISLLSVFSVCIWGGAGCIETPILWSFLTLDNGGGFFWLFFFSAYLERASRYLPGCGIASTLSIADFFDAFLAFTKIG